jgi:hypothetical protein
MKMDGRVFIDDFFASGGWGGVKKRDKRKFDTEKRTQK